MTELERNGAFWDALPFPVRERLLDGFIKPTLRKPLRLLTDADLLRVPGIGKRSLHMIRETMKRTGVG